MTKPLLERFNEKYTVCPDTGCWLWNGARDRKGYGRIGLSTPKKGTALAHRVSYELFIGPIHEGLLCLHTCNNGHKGCVNPTHLKLGTHSDNMHDMALAGSKKGERNSRSKLTEELVREIRNSAESGVDIADRLGVSQVAISRVRNGKRWSHVK